jgi:hypothetical protein
MKCSAVSSSLAGSLLLVGLAGGCALDDDPGDAYDVSSDQAEVLGPTYTELALPWHGGGGGGYTGHVTPPAVIFGVQLRSGTLVDGIRFAWYQAVTADNSWHPSNPWGWTPWYGGGGGAYHAPWYCPTQLRKGVIGIRGNSGTLLDRFGVICGDVDNPVPTDPGNTYSPLWGGGGGGWFTDFCPAGYVVDSFNVRSGTLVDGLQAICIAAH